NRRSAASVVTKKDTHTALNAFALRHKVIDVPFFFENTGDFQFKLRGRNIHARVLRSNSVANSRQHIGNRISHVLLQFACLGPAAGKETATEIGNVITSSL